MNTTSGSQPPLKQLLPPQWRLNKIFYGWHWPSHKYTRYIYPVYTPVQFLNKTSVYFNVAAKKLD